MNVLKANNITEPFSEEKVLNSIKRAKIAPDIQEKVLTHVKTKLYEGIPTSEIYKHIIEFLGQSQEPYSRTRYSLKESIMQLGPTGFPFEDFIAKLLQNDGFETQVRQILQGECITHEIDVIAKRDNKTSIIEAKFHNSPGVRSQIHVALYTQARFEDVKEKNNIDDTWLITNTKTTADVNTYAKCKNMTVISWDYPTGNSLRDMIERSKLHPITSLIGLNQSQKATLLNNHVVLCKDVCTDKSTLDLLHLSDADKEKVFSEAQFVCKLE